VCAWNSACHDFTNILLLTKFSVLSDWTFYKQEGYDMINIDIKYLVKKLKGDIALHGKPISELLDVTCHMGSHSVTCNPTQVNAPRLTPAMQACTRFTYPGGMKGWVDTTVTSQDPLTETINTNRWRKTHISAERVFIIGGVNLCCRTSLYCADNTWQYITCCYYYKYYYYEYNYNYSD